MKKAISRILIIFFVTFISMIAILQTSIVKASQSDTGKVCALKYVSDNSWRCFIQNLNENKAYVNTFCMQEYVHLNGNDLLTSQGSVYSQNLTHQKALNWIFDNMYLDYYYYSESTSTYTLQSSDSTTLAIRSAYLENLKSILKEYYPSTYINDMASLCTNENQIYKIQQYAIWHFTNGYEFLSANCVDKAASNWSGPETRLYRALVTKATVAETNSFVSSNATQQYPTINKSSAKLNKTTGLIGPFTISNNNGTIGKNIVVSASLNKEGSNNYEYTIVNSSGNAISNFTGSTSTNSNLYNGQFYVKINNLTFTTNTTYNINVNFVFSGYKTIGEYWTADQKQPLVTLTRTPYKQSITANFTYYQGEVDLALKKQIVSVEDRTNINIKNYSRLESIDTTPLDNGKTNANYSMNKTAISVNRGDIVTYELRVYNEGTILANATEIVDYLPDGLVLAEDEENPVALKYSMFGNLTYNYLEDKSSIVITINNAGLMGGYDLNSNSTLDYMSIYVKCKVVDSAKGVLTNTAEITAYKYKNGNSTNDVAYYDGTNKDRDSSAANWNSPNGTGSEYEKVNVSEIKISSLDAIYKFSDEEKTERFTYVANRGTDAWSNYANAQQSWLDDEYHNFVGQQDDDDFEKIEVQETDIALKKYITTVKNASGTTTYNRLADISNLSLMAGLTNAWYFMNKTPVNVQVGDEITYAIRITNEGKVNAAASKVVDYLPSGLTYTGEAYIQLSERSDRIVSQELIDITEDNNSASISYDSTTNIITLNYTDLSLEAATHDIINSKSTVRYYTFYVVCRVESNATGVLTNVAEITQYKQNDSIILSSDVDSTSNNWQEPTDSDKSTLVGKDTDAWNYYVNQQQSWLDGENHYFAGQEDDDDFEKVQVGTTVFDLALRKSISKVVTNAGETTETEVAYNTAYSNVYDTTLTSRITKRLQTLNTTSWEDFEVGINSKSTLKYYHAKDVVTAEKGNHVVYRIRVYNEGNVNGKALKIADYLPSNLVLAEYTEGDGSINDTYGWNYATNYGTVNIALKGYTKIETTYTANTVIDAVDVENQVADYIDVFVECVLEDNATGMYITNRAEIAESVALDSNGDVIEGISDFDSTANNVGSEIDSQREGLENVIGILKIFRYFMYYYVNYGTTGVENSQLTYFPGTEDDDDFETLYVEEDETTTYNLRVLKIDSETKDSLDGIGFSVTGTESNTGNNIIAGNTTLNATTLTTGTGTTFTYNGKEYTGGMIEINNIPVTASGYHVYDFDETTLPSQYAYSLVDAKFSIKFASSSSGSLEVSDIIDKSDNTQLDLEYDEDTNTVIVVIKNNPEGKYKFDLYKVDSNGETITSYPAMFLVQYSNGMSGLIATTDGKINLLEETDIKSTGTETIKIMEAFAPKGYKANRGLITITIEKYYDTQTNGYAARIVSVVNANDSTIEYEYSSNKVSGVYSLKLEIPNEEMTGAYNLKLKKISQEKNTDETITQTPLSGVKFELSGDIVTATGEDTMTTDATDTNGFTNTITKTIENYESLSVVDEITLDEVQLGTNEGKYATLTSPITIYVTKGIVGTEYQATIVSFSEAEEVLEKEVTLSNGTVTTATLNLSNNTIIITVPNEKIAGSYSIAIEKVDAANPETKISGVTFLVKKYTNAELETISMGPTAETTGLTSAVKITMDSDTIDEKDTFTVEEVNLSNNENQYIKLSTDIKVYVTKENLNSAFVLKGISFTEDGTPLTSVETTAELEDGTEVTLKAAIEDGVIKITIPNKKIIGGYSIKIQKVNLEDITTKISGVTFKLDKKVNDVTYTNIEAGPTNAETSTLIQDVTIDGTKLNTKDEYKITEVNTGNNNLIKLANSVTVYVTKGIVNNGYVATGISFTEEGTPATTATLNTTLQNGEAVQITATLENGVITITIPNKEMQGKYQLQIEKVDVDDQTKKLKDVVFGLETVINNIEDSTTLEPTGENGITQMGEVTIDGSKLEVKDEYKIAEINLGDNRYLKLADEITLYISKGIVNYNFAVTGISFTSDDEVTTTDTIEAKLTNGSTVNVTAKIENGVVTITVPNRNADFDLALKKWVSKAIVIENENETITQTGHTGEENPEPVVKVDLKKSKLKDVTVKFEYQIKVTNEGEIAGIVKEITDYIPSGLIFNQDDNPDWTIEDGLVKTTQLSGLVLQPGESASVTIILTWINDENNMGTIINSAEISEDYNEPDIPDGDSTPGNFTGTPEEDDEDIAPVMITIQTGQKQMYIVIVISIIAVVGTGVILIKKYAM